MTACYTAVAKVDPSCGISCSGLFADVEFTEDDIVAKIENAVRGLENKGNFVPFVLY